MTAEEILAKTEAAATRAEKASVEAYKASKAAAARPASRCSPKTKAANSFVFPCSCCDGELVPAHLEAGGLVVSCPSCRMSFRFAGQLIRPPDADAVTDKVEAAYECGRIGKRAYQKAHNKEVTPEPTLPDDAETD